MGEFCCHGKQNKRQITIILAILNCPYQSNLGIKLEFSASVVMMEFPFKIPFLKKN